MIIGDNEKGIYLLIGTANLGYRHMFKAEAEKILNCTKVKQQYSRCGIKKSDTGNNRGNWKLL